MRDGFLQLGRFGRAPVRMHVTAPLGAIVFSGLRAAPLAWLGFLLVILAHELGHAVLVRRFGLRLLAVEVQAFGGLCRFEGDTTPLRRSLIAWGGVLAQTLVLGLTLIVALLLPGVLPADALDALVRGNLVIMGLNLLPIAPLDGAEAWQLPRLLRLGRRKRRLTSEVEALQAEIDRLQRDGGGGRSARKPEKPGDRLPN